MTAAVGSPAHPASPSAGPAASTAAELTSATLSAQLSTYCRHQCPQAQAVSVQGLQRIFGGASRETWRFTLCETSAGQETKTPLILRRDPAASLIDTERRCEVSAYRLFECHPQVPVPRVWWLEEDPAWLGSPFFVMEAVTGCEAGPQKLMAEPFAGHHAALAAAKWQILGHIARANPAGLLDSGPAATAETAWRRELAHWQATVEREALEPQPIAQAAIRWLHAHPPPPAQRLAVVHGDYRTGNFLASADGQIRAILDWEMAHRGDPLEDLAWSLNRAWCFQGDDRAGGLAARDVAIAHWEQASGLRADPAALHWWELLACVKGQGIWLGAARAFAQGANRDLMMAFAAWLLTNSQDRAMLELMGHLR